MSVSISIKEVNFNRLMHFFLMILLKHKVVHYFVTLGKPTISLIFYIVMKRILNTLIKNNYY